MGSTTITNYAVQCISADLPVQDARNIYVLWEETYENNCYPHTPSWCSRFVGTYAECVERIMRWAAGCAGGGLKSRNGQTVTPVAFVKKWVEAFKTPLVLDPETDCLGLCFGSGCYDIPGRFFGLFNEALSGYTRNVTEDRRINVPLGTHAIAERLASAFRAATSQPKPDENIFIWQIFRSLSGFRGAFEHPKAVVAVPEYQVVFLGETPIYDGRYTEKLYASTAHNEVNAWRVDRAAYLVEASVVSAIGSTPGLTLPQAAKVLGGVRAVVNNAQQADEATTYILTTVPIGQTNDATDWDRACIRKGLEAWNSLKAISPEEREDILRQADKLDIGGLPVVIPVRSLKDVDMAWLCQSSLVHEVYVNQNVPFTKPACIEAYQVKMF